ncbi:MAG TPA: FadR/GntR family transcriptional regulator [Puia sp.]|jgi:DNA-binding FadR family transcriptional regulator|uniref:FadR/GntR family transcriptional regulator n=1 Tax=Puia sp. TaxID=2045100 RepID=UPI002CE72783|nr:FadR/GntR family transcriptional regulator [Puia sp.]HVU98554.1 FadR/GntR family transcriptional regulator [Puia sp.]
MKKNSPLPRHSLADAVVGRLQQQLSLGVYKPGDKLPSEPELMAEFGVGRSTIREAVRILANTGLLTVRQGSGTMVEAQRGIAEPLPQRLRRASAADLDEVRQLLEIKIAEKAALLRTRKDITKMKALLDERNTAAMTRDIEGAIRSDIQFHIAIAVASRNDILADLYRTVAEQMTRHFHQTHLTTQKFIESQQLHEQLLQAIIDQDPKKAWQYAEKIATH